MKAHGFKNAEFFMDTSYFAYPRKKVKGKKIENYNKYIVINLNRNAEKFLPNIIDDVKRIYNQGYEVKYVPVAKGNGEQYNDIRYAHKIQKAAEIKDQQFTILDRENDFNGFIKTLASASMVISSRLHLFLISSFL